MRWNLDFPNFSNKVKSIVLRFFEPTKWLVAQGATHALRHRLGKRVFVKENEKNIGIKEACKVLEMVNSFSK